MEEIKNEKITHGLCGEGHIIRREKVLRDLKTQKLNPDAKLICPHCDLEYSPVFFEKS